MLLNAEFLPHPNSQLIVAYDLFRVRAKQGLFDC
jgi:hypothetical protein